jgi:lipoprotein-anchoring transpeptidase ErfK/SrfK
MARIARGFFAMTVLTLIVSASAVAATASADPTPTPPPPTTPPPTPVAPPAVPVPPAAAGHLRIAVADAFRSNRQNVTITGRSFHVDGVATPFVAGQVVTLRIWSGRHLVKSETVRLVPSRSGTYGHFSVRYSSRSAATLKVTAVHDATPQQVRLVSDPKKVAVVVPSAGPGSRGKFVALIQSRLAALHFAVPHNGIYDQYTANAVMAYRKVRGWSRTFTLDRGVIRGLLNGVGTFQVRYPKQGRHVEADLTDQTLALINGSKVYAVYPVSSGKPSTPTILGTYHVYMKTPGYLPDGMYYSNFFIRGYAIHGYDPSPTYPASHGCLRLPIDDAIAVYDWVQLGTPVDVYYGAN